MSDAGLKPVHTVSAMDQSGALQNVNIAGEHPLTITLDGHEIVTLMTIGEHPEELVLGYLRNQRLVENFSDIAHIMVDWVHERADVKTVEGKETRDLKQKLAGKIVTSGCGQGTLFSCSMDKLYDVDLQGVRLKQSEIYMLLRIVAKKNQVYRQAGAVHACALCFKTQVLIFFEDVGRHNATDAISGRMWINDITGSDKILYTTGRITSEIVIKGARMGIPVLLSRSGITHMALEIARDLKMTIVGRAKNKRFLVYNGHENIVFDS